MGESPDLGFVDHFVADSLNITQPRRVGRLPTIQHAFERLYQRIRHAEPSIIVTDYGMDASVSRVLQLLKDRPIEWLTDAEHAALAGSDLGWKPDNKLLSSASWRLGHVNRSLNSQV